MNVKTEYSIVSRGSEKYLNKGYMLVSYPEKGYRYIQDYDHGFLFSEVNSHSLKIKDLYSIENIALSRFELIPELLFSRISIDDNILVCGTGCVGFATINCLISHGYKNITVLKNKYDKFLNELKFNIKYTSEINSNYKTYIDATGNSTVIETIFNSANNMSNIILLSTPMDNLYINPLIICRKNLTVHGGHEINGYNQDYRNSVLNRLLEKNKNMKLSNITNISKYSNAKLENTEKIYEIFYYGE